MSKKKLATDLEEDWMKGACWMGGEPEKVRELLSEYQYSRSFLEHCIELVMNSHSCRTTYAWALDCKGQFEVAIRLIPSNSLNNENVGKLTDDK